MKVLGKVLSALLVAFVIATSSVSAQTLCTDVFQRMDEVHEAGAMCRKVHESGGAPDIRIFVIDDGADEDYSALVEPIARAAARSREVFGAFAAIPSVDFVISNTIKQDRKHGILGDANVAVEQRRCGSVIYGPEFLSLSSFVRRVEFATAHEMFHCFQFKNLQVRGIEGGNGWWVEGSAEYFANVVYPDYDIEHNRLSGFSSRAETVPLTLMKYEAYVLFQYMENTGLTHNDIFSFLRAAPLRGGQGRQRAFLESYPNFAELFQRFAQAYFDGAIRDTNGGQLFDRRTGAQLVEITETGRNTIKVLPFAFTPRTLLMRGAEPIELDDTFEGGEGRHRERYGSSWGDLPSIVEAPCSTPRRSFLVVTSVDANADALQLHINAIVEPCPECVKTGEQDRCLIGRWRVSDESAAAFIQTRFGDIGEVDHFGEGWMEFRENGRGQSEIKAATTRLLKKIAIGVGDRRREIETETVMTLYGTSTFEWSTTEGFLHGCPINEDFKYDYVTRIDGRIVGEEFGRPLPSEEDLPAEFRPPPSNETVTVELPVIMPPEYRCNGSQTFLVQLVPGQGGALMIELNKQ